MDFIERGGLRLSYESVGEGDPVIAIHSGGLSRRQWKRLRDRLAPTHRVIVPDLLGYGDSTPWEIGAPFHLDRDVEMLNALVDRVGPAHLVGHSYGGLLALKVALSRRPRSLALFEPVAFSVLDRTTDADAFEILDRLPMRYDLGAPDRVDESWIAAFVAFWNGPGAYSTLTPDARNAFRAAGWKVFQEVVSLTTDATPSNAYRALDMPVLLLGGERSPMPAGRVLERLETLLPNARRHVFAGLGHMAPVTAAEVVNQHIAALLLS